MMPQPRDLSPFGYALQRLSQRFAGATLFGPGQPLQPTTQETSPRRMQYPSSVNMVWQPRRDWPVLTPFETLRYLSRKHPLAALCVRVRAQHIMGLAGSVVTKDKRAAASEQGAIDAITRMFEAPDGQTPRAVWLQQLVRDILEIDAPTVYKGLTRGGGLAELRVIDGSTIKPLLDDRGRVVAYQQVIYGLALSQYLGRRVADDEQEVMGEYDAGELWYQPFNATVTDPYGRAPMEDLLALAQTYLRKIDSDLTRFTDGNIPAALGVFDAGSGMDVDQVATFEENFNAEIQGIASRASRIKFIPFPIKVERLQELSEGGKYESDWEERNVKLVCAAYGVTPAEIGFTADVNRATAEGQENTQYRIGIRPLALWLKTVLFDPIIQRDMGQSQLEWQWDFGEAEDRERVARIDNIYYGAGAVSADELRQMRYPDLEGKAPGQPPAGRAAAATAMAPPATKAAELQAPTAARLEKAAGPSGAIVALWVPEQVAHQLAIAAELAGLEVQPEAAEAMHITLAYLGRAASLEPHRAVIARACAALATDLGPLEALVTGVGRFATDEGDGTNALWAAVDGPQLQSVRRSVLQALRDAGVTCDESHAFTPHITLAYIPADAPTPQIDLRAIDPLQFAGLTLAWGGERTVYPLGATLTKRGEADTPPDENQRAAARTRLERAIRRALGAHADRVIAALRSATDGDIATVLTALWPAEASTIARDVLLAYDAAVAAGMQAAAAQLPAQADWGMANADALRLARERAQRYGEMAAHTSEGHVAQLVADWVETGGTLPDLIARAEAVTAMWGGDRVDVAVITEVTDLFAQANRQAWAASGLVTGYRVETAEDERVCPICGPRQGQVYPIDDTTNLPPYHGRCRCWIVPEVD